MGSAAYTPAAMVLEDGARTNAMLYLNYLGQTYGSFKVQSSNVKKRETKV
jgi:hypothetical protein